MSTSAFAPEEAREKTVMTAETVIRANCPQNPNHPHFRRSFPTLVMFVLAEISFLLWLPLLPAPEDALGCAESLGLEEDFAALLLEGVLLHGDDPSASGPRPRRRWRAACGSVLLL